MVGIPNAITKTMASVPTRPYFIPKPQLCHTTNVKRKFDGAHSDHAALCIDFFFLNTPLLKKKKEPKNSPGPPKKLNYTILRRKELSNLQKKIMNSLKNSYLTWPST
jgi:hypothetical protein